MSNIKPNSVSSVSEQKSIESSITVEFCKDTKKGVYGCPYLVTFTGGYLQAPRCLYARYLLKTKDTRGVAIEDLKECPEEAEKKDVDASFRQMVAPYQSTKIDQNCGKVEGNLEVQL
jgi:hypothetical protein